MDIMKKNLLFEFIFGEYLQVGSDPGFKILVYWIWIRPRKWAGSATLLLRLTRNSMSPYWTYHLDVKKKIGPILVGMQ